jgi:WD40 repeat protein
VVYTGGKLYICVSNGNRIVGFNSLPTSPYDVPDFAVGAPDINTNTLEVNYIITNPVPVSDGTSLFVSSDFDGKLYVWKNRPDESGAKPDIIYDLPFGPWDSALFENKYILAGGQDVYIWNTLPRNGEMPDKHLSRSIGDITFQNLTGVALDDLYFYLADRNANKIYVWECIPDNDTNPKFTIDIQMPTRLSSGGNYLVVAATEASFDERIKFYRIDQLSSGVEGILLTGTNVNLPQAALAVDGHLFIGDTGFNRVLVWNDISDAVNGNAPDVVLGEEDLEDITPEIGVDKLFWPAGISFDGDYLWVGEFKFSGRILRFSPY